MRRVTLLTSLVLLSLLYSDGLRMATFNIQVFGQNKMRKLKVREALIKILERYDITFVQEIRDSEETAFPQLASLLSKTTGRSFAYNVSIRLGKTNSKEQYGVIYNPKLVTIVDTYQEPEDKITFQRPPYAVLLYMPMTMYLMSNHNMSRQRIKCSVSLQSKSQALQLSNTVDLQLILILGDMNADCGYLSKTKLRALAFKKDGDFQWLVKDGQDTTVAAGHCAYDRIIAKDWKTQWYDNSSVHAYRFDEEMKMSPEQAKAVSDHYPVEMQLR
ncbi:deoxyribonuclease-1-like protein [Paragonimus westermani]|uniref:Deoxyribonuclease n=1 Tax=Paragonimus westermani TaxID=34504 RepID=A0A5J4N9F9_9TREM|nr:deoxyribonuclease-1-like protein [Paragonimus westermani]